MPPPPKTIPTRLLLLSDTHNALPLPHPLPSADLLIHSGDLTMTGDIASLSSQLSCIADAPAGVKVVIPGNHDITLDQAFYAENWSRFHSRPEGREGGGETVRQLLTTTHPDWPTKNLHILSDESDIHEITLPNGASLTIYASPLTPAFQDWAFAYPRHVDRFNPSGGGGGGAENHPAVVPDWPGVDVMVTHGPPVGVLDQVAGGVSVGCEHLRRAVERCRPRVHVFGHIHEGWGAERLRWGVSDGGGDVMRMGGEEDAEGGFVRLDLREGGREGGLRWGEETVFVNASVMDVEYKPVQKMWMVDLDLPVKQEK